MSTRPRSRTRDTAKVVLASSVATLVIGVTGAGAAHAANAISTSVLSGLDTALPNVSIDTVAADANRVGPT